MSSPIRPSTPPNRRHLHRRRGLPVRHETGNSTLLILVLLPDAGRRGQTVRAAAPGAVYQKIQDQSGYRQHAGLKKSSQGSRVEILRPNETEEERFVTQVQSAMELSLRRATIMAWFRADDHLRHLCRRRPRLVWTAAARSSTAQSPRRPVCVRALAGILIGPFGSAARVFAPNQRNPKARYNACSEILIPRRHCGRAWRGELPAVRGHACARESELRLRPLGSPYPDVSFEAKPVNSLRSWAPPAPAKRRS